MVTVSLCMIVKNEEDVLGRCLESAKDIFDEIIIIDTGSTDKTKEIASRYTDKIYDFEWIDDFAAARNFAFSKGTCDYKFWLDADDVISETNREKLIKLKAVADGSVGVFRMYYGIVFDEKGNCTYKYYRGRMFLAKLHPIWKGRVHETCTTQTAGISIDTDIEIYHKKKTAENHTPRNLRILKNEIESGSTDPRTQYYYSRELMYSGDYKAQIKMAEIFLENPAGWYVNKISACQDLAFAKMKTGDTDGQIRALVRSFSYGAPTGEVCCDIGKFFSKRDTKTAIFWYETALLLKPDYNSGAFINEDCYGYIPAIELCVLYYGKKDYKKASEMNDLAAQFKPANASVLYNKSLFDKINNEISQNE
ncbi:MAG: glycosyltransferase [Ruminococcus sp.]|jgi:glycosyltransferase involved in cell wall biosynthesis|nr:glycosyltransferase [Ruminococcus sp.]